MSFRIRIAFGIAFLFAIVVPVAAFAKGEFALISITGPGLKEAARVTDAALTTDFFAFANFSANRTDAPASPGEGYEIARYYVDGKREIVFDRLHYYPATGFVFYDGIENGSSEYDGKWYTANPKINTVFELALAAQTGSAAPVEEKQPAQSNAQSGPAASDPGSQPVILIAIATGLAALFVFVLRQRRPSAQ